MREGHSTLDALIYILQEIQEATDRGDCGARIFFADFSKCFDMIDHSFFRIQQLFLEYNLELYYNPVIQFFFTAMRLINGLYYLFIYYVQNEGF